jgi:hypothetical protein
VHLSLKPMACDVVRGLCGEPARPRVHQVPRRLRCVIEASDDSSVARSVALRTVRWRWNRILSRVTVEVAEAPDFEDVVAWPVGVAEMADTGTSAAGFDGGFGCWVPHDHDVPDLVGSQVGVPKDQISWSLLARRDSDAVPGGQPAALCGGKTGIRMPICAKAAWVKLEQSQTLGPVAPMR